ncbi:hypothetical protein B7463_g8479, partial [Scytalidium lignicola]
MPVRPRRPSTAEVIRDDMKKLEKSVKNTFLVLWDDLPSWQQDNHYIRSGYRAASGSFKKSIASLGYIHNESVNIYTHLIGSLLFIFWGSWLYSALRTRYESATSADILAFGCFFAGAAICMGMSATYHAISNHSPNVARFGNKLDYMGIVLLITGSFVPIVYYGFYCHPHLQQLYWTMISSLGVGCICASIFDRFRTPAWRPYRAGMFVAMGLSAVFPIIHSMQLYSIQDLEQRIGLSWVVFQGFLYILGAGFYAARWPERTSPGKFDIWGSSHQIFHILVVTAAMCHLYGCLKAFDYRHGIAGPSC